MSPDSAAAESGDGPEVAVDRGGRPASTSPHELAVAAQRLFLRDGFDETSVEDIAAAVGVSRRTFFRYFATKADVVWVESDAELEQFREMIETSSPSTNPVDVVAEAFISAISHGGDEVEWARQRAELILYAPAVQAHANAVYRQWRGVVAEFVARRTGGEPGDEYPLAVGYAVLSASSAGHERWLADSDADLADCLRPMFALMVPREPNVTNT
ncbi:acyl-CoA-like ligand-binding transcription factor [Gordonia insulae]|uniref:Mycofactocin biosynthesis transcriptional regulator MftR n=1 Tax=Gordonia insulae TaxID=2420509 RepID=A0A3G8JLX4_9ACTN|nr:TetR family transcriptional regulator [Gordonia insulae]AZG46003.1 Putative mycofactocin biosynthesis transcriptional regulator MftR [Gordonia insulae]